MVVVDDQNRGVRALDQIGEKPALRDSGGDPAFQSAVEVFQPRLCKTPIGYIAMDADPLMNLAALAEHRDGPY